MRKMVVRKPDPHFFSNDMSFFLFEFLGQSAPKIYPAKVYLNGVFYSYMSLSSHQAKDQIKLDYGLKDFFYYKQKSENDTIDHLLFEKAINRLKYDKDLSWKEFQRHYDNENLMKNLVINIFTGSQDWPQGSYVKEKGGKWRVIPWDFDTAFRRPYKRTEKQRDLKPAYLHNPYKSIQQYYSATLRWYLFNDFILKRVEYKKAFLGYLNEFLVQLDTRSEELERRYEYYQLLTNEAQLPAMQNGLEHIKEFMQKRPRVVCEFTKKLFHSEMDFCTRYK